MGKIMEAAFCAVYIVLIFVLGFDILRMGKGKKEYTMFGWMSLVLVFGDSFHLIPRILAVVNPGDYTAALGYGKMITSITMTIFYLVMYYVYEERYKVKSDLLRAVMCVLSSIRVGLCFLPGNDWAGEAPVIWGIYRNIPFTIMGMIMIVLWFKKRSDKPFKWMWLAILLSFAFYTPVVLWADANPIVGMLMMPKTCMYIWAVVMGCSLVKRDFIKGEIKK